MINIFMKLGKTDDCCGGEPLWGEVGDTSQDKVQLIILIVALVCIPLMLFPKPLYETWRKSRRQSGSRQSAEYNNLLSSENINEKSSKIYLT
jgi:hypothetical protein